jgi:hypothetical protein
MHSCPACQVQKRLDIPRYTQKEMDAVLSCVESLKGRIEDIDPNSPKSVAALSIARFVLQCFSREGRRK